MRSSAPLPIPTRPPFTAHVGNLPYDATMEIIEEFFDGCGVQSVRIIEDREMQRPKGFAYVEFHEQDGLKKALDRDGEQINGRYVKVKVADSREFLPLNDRLVPSVLWSLDVAQCTVYLTILQPGVVTSTGT